MFPMQKYKIPVDVVLSSAGIFLTPACKRLHSRSQPVISNVQRSMFNVPCSMFNVPCSTFHVPCSTFNVPCSTFHVQRSMFNVPCSTFHVQRSTFHVQRSTFNVHDSPSISPSTILMCSACGLLGNPGIRSISPAMATIISLPQLRMMSRMRMVNPSGDP